MQPRQYRPFTFRVNGIPLITYPVKDENPLSDVFDNRAAIEDHLSTLYKKFSELQKRRVSYFICLESGGSAYD